MIRALSTKGKLPKMSKYNTIANSVNISNCIQFVKSETDDMGYDESHGVNHAKAVFSNVQQMFVLSPSLLANFAVPNIDPIPVVYVAALVHDVIDHKYVTTDEAVAKKERLFHHISSFLGPEEVVAVERIIDNTSYSKEKKGKLEQLGELMILRDIVSDADKLEAIGEIGLERCFEYQRNLVSDITSEELEKQVYEHCQDKLSRLLKDNYIRTEPGKILGSSRNDVILNFMKEYESKQVK
eukprot:TRINITY_DN9335_c0_g1_i2.p1 TRINITY_DN9335_c0_g1~~TRINITY_DN9335_c0_g1_i2.p1  ORF type:complete len:240 (+),score=38.97 TRINITY_DN9335_c0_g1_i2:177-896(+)